MKYLMLVLVVALAGAGAWYALRTETIESGEIVTCKICERVISNSVSAQAVPWWSVDDPKYRISKTSSYCSTCGNKPIRWTADILCSVCGKKYSEHSTTVRLNDNPKRRVRYGHCGKWCSMRDKVRHVSARAGQMSGDLIEGLIRGAENR